MYKLIIILITTILFSSSIVYAQDNKIDIGVQTGPSLVFISGNKMASKYTDPALSYTVGLTFQKNISQKFSLRSGLTYENKGASAPIRFTNDQGDPIGEVKSRFNYRYLTLPILAKGSFGNKTKFFINAGPFLGFLLKQTFSYSELSVGGESDSKIIEDNTANNKRIDIGLSAGFGLTVPVGNKINLTYELRYSLGLLNTSKAPVYGNGSIKTNSANFLLGIAFKIGAKKTKSK